MYEQLPAPYGLVRYGVAPDHPEVKNCQDKCWPRPPLTSLRPHYDAILFAYGAAEDKRLGIPGEDLKNIYSARAFVGWYNGLPQYADLNPALDAGEESVIIGQGNVAMDVARILLSDIDALRKTDITEYALDTLFRSRVKNVKVVGRRGPMQAAFTIKEVRELLNLPSVSFEPIPSDLLPPDPKKLPRQQRRIAEILAKGSPTPLSVATKSWAFRFLHAPSAFNPSPSNPSTLSSTTFNLTRFTPDSNPTDRSARVEPTDKSVTLPSALAFRSVGYKSLPLPGLSDLGVPFDKQLGIIPNDLYGRVLDPSTGPGALTAGHVPGMYCAGWVKRGPTGVIASTMEDAFTSGDVIVSDWENGVPFLKCGGESSTGLGWEGVRGRRRRGG
ncbi:NADPH-adrenodoxin reductase [Coniosporium tulheliwenetii]|uniref:NADPH-adrenodoxin reductase n=1 Tax=Coniosporium tulheliwenetii TaxID=3383036 RepID=A0ACC2YNR7_9PEZI|nr:NADPH-adrenodoxin reductase [Cladosporium sp. JES 115]